MVTSLENKNTKANRQLVLRGLIDLGIDEEEVPEGMSSLTVKDLRFISGLLRHGIQSKAALEAGYGKTIEAAGKTASEKLRKVKVFRFYQKCLKPVAQDAQNIVMSVYERHVLLHHKFMELGQDIDCLDEEIESGSREEETTEGKFIKSSKQVTEYELKRDRLLREQKAYAAMVNQTDTLLASLLGKLNLNITGELAISGEALEQVGNEYTIAFAKSRKAYESRIQNKSQRKQRAAYN